MPKVPKRPPPTGNVCVGVTRCNGEWKLKIDDGTEIVVRHLVFIPGDRFEASGRAFKNGLSRAQRKELDRELRAELSAR